MSPGGATASRGVTEGTDKTRALPSQRGRRQRGLRGGGGAVLKDVPWTPRSHSKERIVQCVWTTAGTQDAV